MLYNQNLQLVQDKYLVWECLKVHRHNFGYLHPKTTDFIYSLISEEFRICCFRNGNNIIYSFNIIRYKYRKNS